MCNENIKSLEQQLKINDEGIDIYNQCILENENNKDHQKFPNSNLYHAYIGEGNNSQVVRTVLKARNWWCVKEKLKAKDWNFIWTQWLKRKIIDKLEGVQSTMYNRLEGNHSISNKKELFLNLMEFYHQTNQDPHGK